MFTSVVSVSFFLSFLLLHVDTVIVCILGSAVSLAVHTLLSLTLLRICVCLSIIGHQNGSRIAVIWMVGFWLSMPSIICKQTEVLNWMLLKPLLVKGSSPVLRRDDAGRSFFSHPDIHWVVFHAPSGPQCCPDSSQAQICSKPYSLLGRKQAQMFSPLNDEDKNSTVMQNIMQVKALKWIKGIYE